MSDLNASSCGCTPANHAVDNIYGQLHEAGAPLAMGYVPKQQWTETYDLCKALHAGTIFPCLHKPFCGKGGKCR